MTKNILRVEGSMMPDGMSTTRKLNDRIVEHLSKQGPTNVVLRNLVDGVPFVSVDWFGGNIMPAEKRTDAQKAAIAQSEEMVAELQAADIIVIGSPVYNFGPTAALKAWVDQICRLNLTFHYTENGAVGLLEGKKAYVSLASGGTKIGSEIDFLSGWLKYVLSFIGITDVEMVYTDGSAKDPERIPRALAKVDDMFAD